NIVPYLLTLFHIVSNTSPYSLTTIGFFSLFSIFIASYACVLGILVTTTSTFSISFIKISLVVFNAFSRPFIIDKFGKDLITTFFPSLLFNPPGFLVFVVREQTVTCSKFFKYLVLNKS